MTRQTKHIKVVKQGGQIYCQENIFSQLENYLKIIPNGQYTLTLNKLVKQRTISQNNLMWVWFTCIEKETGTPKEDIHDYYCSRYLSRIAIVHGHEETVVSGTSKLSTVQMKDFLDKVQADVATELGIELPEPDSQHWADFYETYKPFLH